MHSTNIRQRHASLLERSHTINSAVIDGVDGRLVEVQARAVAVLPRPLPWHKAVTVAGMPKGEAADMLIRIGGAINQLGFADCPVRVMLNFHSDGSGPSLDLPSAIAVMLAAGKLPEFDAGDYLIFGALDLHGVCRATPGALALCMAARDFQSVVCPEATTRQARLALLTRKIIVHPIPNLETLVSSGSVGGLDHLQPGRVAMKCPQSKPVDFVDVIGQESARAAAEIAAAGGHGLLMISSPGAGKTLIANAIAGILPPLSSSEQVELTRIYGAAGQLDHDAQAIILRPFRTVHHSVTEQALIGGSNGGSVQPGEVTLAHLGVLFLDELPHFDARVLDGMRQPMEDGCVRISRVRGKVTLPCRFSLVAAMNPCPCGAFDPDGPTPDRCTCTPQQVQKYQSTISGPLMDRIDLKVPMRAVKPGEKPSGESSADIRERVCAARERQRLRYAGTDYACNADVPGTHLRRLMNISEAAWVALAEACERIGASMRGHDRLAKVARTVADLEGAEFVLECHVREAERFA